MAKKHEEEKACPTMAGTYYAYDVEERRDGKWMRCPRKRVPGNAGIPGPAYNGGINEALQLLGYEQALALYWRARAEMASEARGWAEKDKLRIVEYRVEFELKAFKGKLVKAEAKRPKGTVWNEAE